MLHIEKEHGRLYEELAGWIAREVASGTFPVGSRIPAERELAAQFSVSRATVREAFVALEVRGLIEVRVGKGAFVRCMPI